MDVLVKPLITEQMTNVSEKMPNRYGFIVNKRANKLEIKKAVEELYSVQVVSVNTMAYQGKARSRMTKSGSISGRTNSFKKAIVTLIEGETIDFYSNI